MVKLRPAPPPRWVVKSAARVGEMWADTYRAYGALPKPNMAADVLEVYEAAISRLSEPLRRQAVAAFRMCIRYCARYHQEAAEVAHCETELARLATPQTVALEELLPTPRHLSEGLRVRPLERNEPSG